MEWEWSDNGKDPTGHLPDPFLQAQSEPRMKGHSHHWEALLSEPCPRGKAIFQLQKGKEKVLEIEMMVWLSSF